MLRRFAYYYSHFAWREASALEICEARVFAEAQNSAEAFRQSRSKCGNHPVKEALDNNEGAMLKGPFASARHAAVLNPVM